MANLLLDLTNYIINQGLATQDGLDIFRDYRPDDPDEAIFLAEYNGTAYTFDYTANRLVQVQVRSNTAAQAFNKVHLLYRALINPQEPIQMNLSEGRWALITPVSSPTLLTRDHKQRVIYSFNISVITSID